MQILSMKWRFSVIVVAMLTLIGCQQEQPTVDNDIAPLVKTYQVVPSKGQQRREYPGKVFAHETATLSFLVSGKVANLPFRSGHKVKKGDLIAALDPTDYQHKADEQQAAFDKAKLDLSRAERLVGTGAIPKAKYDEAKTNFDIAKANLKSANKAVEDTKMYSPYDGIIANTKIELHEFVQAKQAILIIQDISHADIEIQIPEQDLVGMDSIQYREVVKSDIKAHVFFPALENRQFQVSLKEFSIKADQMTQSFRVRFTMPMPKDLNLLPGMTATIQLVPKQQDRSTVSIPNSALNTDSDGSHYVWLLKTDDTVHKQMITLGQLVGDHIKVTSGLQVGDIIVSAGTNLIRDGMKVRRQEVK